MGRGIERNLDEWCVTKSRSLGISRLMSSTNVLIFFEKLAFVIVKKDPLPLKVWSDCVRCPKRFGCDEIAMVRELPDVSVSNQPPAAPTPRGVSIPVLDAFEE